MISRTGRLFSDALLFFKSRVQSSDRISTRQYGRVVDNWVSIIGLELWIRSYSVWHPLNAKNQAFVDLQEDKKSKSVSIIARSPQA
jgi:hypothetical protein